MSDRASARAERLKAMRAAIVGKARQLPPLPAGPPRALIDALGEVEAAAVIEGERPSREWQALHHRAEVDRLSREGATVATIAEALDLSTRHVVALRAQLGVGRRR